MKTSNELQQFIGKVCSIFTRPINRNFREESESFIYFVGRIVSVSNQGILMEQVTNTKSKTPLRSYYFLEDVVGIAEEQVLNEHDPQDAKIINSIKEHIKQQIEPKPPTSPYVDADSMMELSAQLKQLHGES